MNCPICNSETKVGGLVAKGQWVQWFSQADFEKSAISQLFTSNYKKLGTPSLSGSTKISNAYYCKTCNKIIGIFDIVD